MAHSLKKSHTLDAKQDLQSLTKREREVLSLVVNGMKNQQMADLLCVSLRTIEVHRSNVMKKLQADNLAELLRKVAHLI